MGSFPHDIVIRNGTLVDGTGLPRTGPTSRSTTAASSRSAACTSAAARIDAEGHVVTPGFIDGHTHMDAQVFWDPLGTCSCWHGVTTVVMGNCGFTLAPVNTGDEALVVRNLERAEDISRRPWRPASTGAGRRSPSTSTRSTGARRASTTPANIGHSALRTWAMGERAFEEEASDDDLALMERELRDAMHAGAIGFTTSRSDQHETSDDRPVASRLASWDEVCRLVGVMGDLGTGIFEITPQFNRGMDPAEQAAVSSA